MSFSTAARALAALSFLSTVAGHASITGLLCKQTNQQFGGITWAHEDPSNAFGWITPDHLMNEFVDPPRYGTPAIVCNTDNKPPPQHAPVPAGSTLEATWSSWPDHHRGFILTYLALCPGSCSSVDPSSLEFFKIAEASMTKDIPSDQPTTGHWPTDDLRANGNKWDIPIPKDIADGNYVLRHEIIALQEVKNTGAQNYARCYNLKISGGGSARPKGVRGTELYKASDPGLNIDILEPQPNGVVIPGPKLYNGAGGGGSGSSTSPSTASDSNSGTSIESPSAAGTSTTSSPSSSGSTTDSNSDTPSSSSSGSGSQPATSNNDNDNDETDSGGDQQTQPPTQTANKQKRYDGDQETESPKEIGNGNGSNGGAGKSTPPITQPEQPKGGENGECTEKTVTVTVTATPTPSKGTPTFTPTSTTTGTVVDGDTQPTPTPIPSSSYSGEGAGEGAGKGEEEGDGKEEETPPRGKTTPTPPPSGENNYRQLRGSRGRYYRV